MYNIPPPPKKPNNDDFIINSFLNERGDLFYKVKSKDGKLCTDLVTTRGMSNDIIKECIKHIKQDLLKKESLVVLKDYYIPEKVEYKKEIIEDYFSNPVINKLSEVKPIGRNYVKQDIQEIPKHIEPKKKSIFRKLF
jgi:hypothetical protein